MSSSFPSSEERTVASSLLLLNTASLSSSLSTPNDEVPERRSGSKRFKQISVSYGSDKSSSSSLTNDDGDSSEKEIKSRSVSFSAVTLYHQMKLKIARKIRTKVAWTSSCSSDQKPSVIGEVAAKVLSPATVSCEASSCLSSSSSGRSTARSLRYAKRCRGAVASVAGMKRETVTEPPRRAAGSPHLRRRCDAILKVLSCCGGSSELKIRQMLGDSPDTSKALRMLLRVDAVKRTGSGGLMIPTFTR